MYNIGPNNNKQTSTPGNNPVAAPFLGLPHGWDLQLGKVQEEAALGSEGFGFIATPQGPHNMLMELRNKFPFVPIRAYPSVVRTYILDGVNPIDIPIPTHMVLGSFSGTANYFVSHNGKASLPVVGDGNLSQQLVNPNNINFYMANLNQLSIISPVNGCIVSLYGYINEEMPRY